MASTVCSNNLLLLLTKTTVVTYLKFVDTKYDNYLLTLNYTEAHVTSGVASLDLMLGHIFSIINHV